MNFEDRLALLQQLYKVKPGSARAKQILRSLQTYQPKITPAGQIKLNNPVTGVNSTIPIKNNKYEVSFSTREGLRRPKTPNSKIDQLGIRATVGQALDQIPPARGNTTGRPSSYSFFPIADSGDVRTNQRALAYRYYTNGAFSSYPDKGWGEGVPDYKGYGERIKSDTWQPRNAQGRFGRYAKFDPTDAVKRLGTYAASSIALRRLAGANPYVQGGITANDIIAHYTGVNPLGVASRFIVDETFGTGQKDRQFLTRQREQALAKSTNKYNTKDPDGRIRSRLAVGPKIVGPGKVGTIAENFDAAFTKARDAGKDTFTWRGKLYTTELR